MPQRTRDLIKQDIERAIGNLDNAGEKLARWIEPMNENHQDKAMGFIMACEAITELKKLLAILKDDI